MTTTLCVAALVAAVLAQAADPADAVRRLAAATSNDARFEAMTAMLRERNLPFTVERFTIERPNARDPRTEGRNLVVSFGPGAGGLVVGAHYDAVRLPDGSLSRGAVDNAGSSAILLRLAEAFKAQPPAGRVTLVWFDMEELGLVGSAKYAEAHAADRIAAMINLDVNAYGDTVVFGASTGSQNAAVRKAVLETCAATDASCVGMPQMPPGDDRSFVKAGIPSVSLAIVSAVEAHQLWLLMRLGGAPPPEPYLPAVLDVIHTPKDTPDRAVAADMVRMADFTLALLRRLDARP